MQGVFAVSRDKVDFLRPFYGLAGCKQAYVEMRALRPHMKYPALPFFSSDGLAVITTKRPGAPAGRATPEGIGIGPIARGGGIGLILSL